ncbi:hypothetical protein H3143_00980 [Mycoplasma tullyi]|uniref:Mycoplasma lipoprotein C-terminal domain-containing protein n=1 Tax=Mycoplasma tullyi TaxID=1612150 RepID=A0A7D7YGY6_9MOLU|nr:hypothetical protein [Mycoplasma tullyi]QMT98698.1 hypothetical protein H3143_00980 [Mycoplasma tullyi]
MRKKTKFYMYSVAAFSSLGILLSSCSTAATGAARGQSASTQGGGSASTAPKGAFDDKIVIQTAQNRFFPLMHAFSQIVDLYNKQFANTPGFLPVELQQSEMTNATSEAQLTNNVVGSIRSNSPLVPNIILANLNSAYRINSFNRLLDLSNNPIINENYFDSDIYNNFNKIPGATENSDKVFAIPFNLTTTDSLVFNKPVMNLLFKLVKDGGGMVDENSEIYKELKMEEGSMDKIPANKKWKNLEVQNNQVYKDVKVSDDTFSNLESMFEFAKKFTDGLKVKANPEATGQQKDLKVFMLDFGPAVYQKYLWSKLGNSRQSWLWNLKVENNQFDLDFSNLRRTTDKNTIGTTYDFFKNSYTTLGLNDNQVLKSIYFGTGGTSDWTSWDIRTYDTAFGIAPHVGWNQSVLSPFTIRTFRASREAVTQQEIDNAKTNFAPASDVLWKTQLTKLDKSNPNRNTFWIGGSSLVGISTSKQRDEQTKKFLEWLFNNDTRINVPDSPLNNLSVNQILNSVSSYDLTSKEALSETAQKALEATIAKEQTEVDKVKGNPTPETFSNPDWSRIYLNKGALSSLTDWLTFKKELTSDPSNNSIAFIHTDDTANRILSILNGAVSGITRAPEATNLTKENLLTQINGALGSTN